MIRISSLPVAQYCPKSNEIGTEYETTQSARSTVFHKYCETGSWPDAIKNLPEEDIEEIGRWKVPEPFRVSVNNIEKVLAYQQAVKEQTVALDDRFNYLDIDDSVPQNQIATKYPNCIICGHLDMAWDLPELDLVVISDIKSSIYAVKDRTNSLQLHGYGISFAKKMKRSRYIPCIWDASEGKNYIGDLVDISGFDISDLEERIMNAVRNVGGNYKTGSHCTSCWKRRVCPAHHVEADSFNEFAAILNGSTLDSDVRTAIIHLKRMKDTAAKVEELVKDVVRRKGSVLSEDGSKVYCCALRAGRKSLDDKAVAKALGLSTLDKYMKQGKPYECFDWRTNK